MLKSTSSGHGAQPPSYWRIHTVDAFFLDANASRFAGKNHPYPEEVFILSRTSGNQTHKSLRMICQD